MIVMRLIDADNVRNLFDAEFKETRKLILAGETHLDNLAEGFAEADRVIWQMPTVDAVPVVHGHFVHDGQLYVGGVDWWHCSICGRLVTNVERHRFEYCPWCGAKMGDNESEAR